MDAGIRSGYIMEDDIRVYAGGCIPQDRLIHSFASVVSELECNRRILFDCPDPIIIRLLTQFGRDIGKDPSLASIPGIPYLSLWLRRENLQALFQVNFGRSPDWTDPVPVDSRVEMIAVPRGIVCHWIAGNIPLLGLYSLVLATLGKNASIIKIHPDAYPYLHPLIQRLEEVTVEYNGETYSGSIITSSVCLVSFPGKNEPLSQAFSLVADCRVVYGSDDAVKAISRLPHQTHADTIIYGPKYSFSAFDSVMIESPEFLSMLKSLARDIVQFNQAACSSPHTVFFEKSALSLDAIAEQLEEALRSVPERLFPPLDEGIAVSVINTRARYLLDDSRDIRLPDDLKWTICMNDSVSLEEPVQGRCIFIKEVPEVDLVLPLITRKVQTVALGMGDKEKRKRFIRELAFRGVDRVMTPGTMHEYTQPWDGMLGAGRMVRWIAVRK